MSQQKKKHNNEERKIKAKTIYTADPKSKHALSCINSKTRYSIDPESVLCHVPTPRYDTVKILKVSVPTRYSIDPENKCALSCAIPEHGILLILTR